MIIHYVIQKINPTNNNHQLIQKFNNFHAYIFKSYINYINILFTN